MAGPVSIAIDIFDDAAQYADKDMARAQARGDTNEMFAMLVCKVGYQFIGGGLKAYKRHRDKKRTRCLDTHRQIM